MVRKMRGALNFDGYCQFLGGVNGVIPERGAGKTFFVDSRSWGSGSDGNLPGTNPNYPLATIQAAYALCTAAKNDYIVCLDGYDNDTATITIAKTGLHIIGVNGPDHRAPFVWLKVAGTGAAAVFTLQGGNAANVEIAGFTLGADATHPCITTVTGGSTELVYGHIHHCAFAASGDAAFVAQDGILEAAGTGLDGTLIEDCYFGDQLVRDGVRFIDFYWGLIRNCIFRKYGGVGIDQITGGHATGMADVIGNLFYVGTTPAKGAGITITDAGGGIIDGNHSVEDGGHAGNNLFLDTSTGTDTSTKNGWGVNYHGDAVTYPAFS